VLLLLRPPSLPTTAVAAAGEDEKEEEEAEAGAFCEEKKLRLARASPPVKTLSSMSSSESCGKGMAEAAVLCLFGGDAW